MRRASRARTSAAQHKQAGEYLIGLMQRAGMSAGFDALGNIVGRYEAADPRRRS